MHKIARMTCVMAHRAWQPPVTAGSVEASAGSGRRLAHLALAGVHL
jgi:hypothetical protein